MMRVKFNLVMLTAFFLILIFLRAADGDAQAKDLFYVNVQIDAESGDAQELKNIINELNKRNIKATVYATAEYVNKNQDLIDDIHEQGFELALGGYSAGEKLSDMKYGEQKDLLKNARDIVEGCRPCGFFKAVIGFRSRPFIQNDDTFRVLDELGIIYVSGVKPGYANKKAGELPVLEEGHNFYVIPVTSLLYNGRFVYLNDSDPYSADPFLDEKPELKPEEWSDVLSLSMEQSLKNKRPLVLIIHDWHTGSEQNYGYLRSFVDFLDKAEGRAVFLKTHELVTKNMSKKN